MAMWYECHIELITPQFCSLLYTPLVSESDLPLDLQPLLRLEVHNTKLKPLQPLPSTDTRPRWLTERQWYQVLTLSTVEPFCELPEHMITYDKLWRVWYITEQPESGSLPKKMDRQIRGVAKLILINCLRSDRFDEASMLYVERVLKQETSEVTAKALLSVASKGSATEPIIVYSSAPLDVEYILQQIQPICHPITAGDPEALDSMALGQGREDTLGIHFQRCLQKGHWLLLKKNTDAKSCIDTLNRLLQDPTVKTAHKRFLVWMYFDNDDELPANLLTSCHKLYLTLPSTIKDFIRHLYELLGDSRMSAYNNEWSKWCLLSLALFHIAFVTRQTLENNSSPLAQTLRDSQWEEAENMLRTLVTGSINPDSSLIPALISQLSDIYLTGALTEESYNVLSQLMNVYLSPEAIQYVPERVSALTHYTVPKSTSLEDHMAQMEFIYLAQDVSLTGVSPFVILKNQRDEARDINIALRTLNEDKEARKSIQETDWPKYFTGTKEGTLQNMKVKGSFQAIMKQEFEDYTTTALSIASKLKVTDNLNSFHEILDNSVPDFEDTQEDDELRVIEDKLSKLRARGEFLSEMLNQSEPPQSIRLGLLLEQGAAWAAVARGCWGELRAAGLEVVVVTKTLSAAIAAKVAEAEAKGVGEEEEATTLVLERLVLRGACWDNVAEVITSEELGAGIPATSAINLTVMQYTAALKKMMKKVGRGEYQAENNCFHIYT